MKLRWNARTQAVVNRFLLGLVVTEIPVATAVLSNPTPDYKLLAIGLLGGLSTAIEKYVSPQLVTLPSGSVGTLAQQPQAPAPAPAPGLPLGSKPV